MGIVQPGEPLHRVPATGNVNLVCLPPLFLGVAWPYVGPLLLRGVMQDEPDLEFAEGELRAATDRILDGRFNLWLVVRDEPKTVLAAYLSSILIEDDRRYVHLHTMAGGELLEWAHVVAPTMDTFAKAEGCAGIRYEGSPAWSRVLPANVIGTRPDGVRQYQRSLH